MIERLFTRWPNLRPFLIKLLLLVLLIGIEVWQPGLAGITAIPSRFVQAIVLFLSGEGLIWLARRVIVAWYRRRNQLPPGNRDNFVLGINQLSILISFGVLQAAILMVFNIRIREVITAISIIATALVILFKDYLANIMNGIILIFSDQISLDDVVKIGDHRGRIVDMNLLNVQLLNDEDDLIMIPNSSVFAEEVMNFSRRPIKKVSIEFEMSYRHLQRVDELETYLITCLSPFSDRIQGDSYNLKTLEVRKDSVQFKFQYVLLNQADKSTENSIRRTTIREVVGFASRKQAEKAEE